METTHITIILTTGEIVEHIIIHTSIHRQVKASFIEASEERSDGKGGYENKRFYQSITSVGSLIQMSNLLLLS